MLYRDNAPNYIYYQILTASISKIWIAGKRDKMTIKGNKLN